MGKVKKCKECSATKDFVYLFNQHTMCRACFDIGYAKFMRWRIDNAPNIYGDAIPKVHSAFVGYWWNVIDVWQYRPLSG